MKINEITEAPVGGIKQKAQSIGSRVLNKIGAKNTAANLAGKADLGATANKLFRQYNSYLGTQNKSLRQATGQDLKRFLATKNVKVNVPNGPIDSDRLDKMFLKVARDAMANKTRPANTQPSRSGTAQFKSRRSQGAAATPKAASKYSQTLSTAKSLSAKEKRRLIAQLQKTLPATP